MDRPACPLVPIANRPQLEDILNNVIGFASTSSDPICQRLAFGILAKAITAWATNPGAVAVPVAANNGPGGVPPLVPTTQVIPGFEGFIYDRLIPLAFEIPTNPTFKIKDGQAQLVSVAANFPCSALAFRFFFSLSFHGLPIIDLSNDLLFISDILLSVITYTDANPPCLGLFILPT